MPLLRALKIICITLMIGALALAGSFIKHDEEKRT